MGKRKVLAHRCKGCGSAPKIVETEISSVVYCPKCSVRGNSFRASKATLLDAKLEWIKYSAIGWEPVDVDSLRAGYLIMHKDGGPVFEISKEFDGEGDAMVARHYWTCRAHTFSLSSVAESYLMSPPVPEKYS